MPSLPIPTAAVPSLSAATHLGSAISSLPPLPATREGWVELLSSALLPLPPPPPSTSAAADTANTSPSRHGDGDAISAAERAPPPAYKAPLYMYPRLQADGSQLANWGRPAAEGTAAGGANAHKSRQSAVLMLLTPVEYATSGGGGDTDTNHNAHHKNSDSASVCVPDLVFTLTMRTSHMRSHGGQMSFPGGRSDKVAIGGADAGEGGASGGEGSAPSPPPHRTWRWEDPVTTAQREAMEEVGLDSSDYTVLGTMKPLYSTPSKSWVTPVVAIAKPSRRASGVNGTPPAAAPHPSSPSSPTAAAAAGGVRGVLLPPRARPIIASPQEVESLHYLSLAGLLANPRATHHQGVRYYPFVGPSMQDKAQKHDVAGARRRLMKGMEEKEGKEEKESAAVGAAAMPWRGELTGYIMPCFFAQNSDPFAVPDTEGAPQHLAGANLLTRLPRAFTPRRVIEDLEQRARGEFGEASPARAAAVLKEISAHTAALSAASVNMKGSAVGASSPTTTTDADDGVVVVVPSLTAPITETDDRTFCLVNNCQKDDEATLVWGLTAFLLCELIARVTAVRAAAASSLSAVPASSVVPPTPTDNNAIDLTPYLDCSDAMVRDPERPYGPRGTGTECAVVATVTDATDTATAQTVLKALPPHCHTNSGDAAARLGALADGYGYIAATALKMAGARLKGVPVVGPIVVRAVGVALRFATRSMARIAGGGPRPA